MLIISSISDTRLLSLGTEQEAEIEELESLEGFDVAEPTLLACSCDGRAYQVTSKGVRGERYQWSAPDNRKITLASSHQQYLLVAVSGGYIYLLDLTVSPGAQQVAQAHLDQDIACLDLSSFDAANTTLIAAVGLWNTNAVTLLTVPDLKQVDNIDVGTAFLPRSVLTASLAEGHSDSAPYLLIGLGDGSLISYSYRPSSTQSEIIDKSSRKSVALGSRPLNLVKIKTAGNPEAGLTPLAAVLAISDRSTVISATSHKLVFSSVNTKVSQDGISTYGDMYLTCRSAEHRRRRFPVYSGIPGLSASGDSKYAVYRSN